MRRDEAEAQSRAEAEEKRRQELDAERRLAILRGEAPLSPPPPPLSIESEAHTVRRKRDREDEPSGVSFRERRKRKRFGEDDTDFEMRVARERTVAGTDAVSRLAGSGPTSKTRTSDAPIVDSRGHIALFPDLETEEGTSSRNGKNEDAEREAAKKRRELEDQYTMRFANAAGRDGIGVTGSGPWYASADNTGSSREASGIIQTKQASPGKDVWGNDDPNRKLRDAARIVADDPLAMIKRGAAKARDIEKERRAINEEKARELRQLRKEEKRREKRRRHRDDGDDLEGFTLDGQRMSNDRDRDRDHDHDRSHREHRSRSHRKDEQYEHQHRYSSHHDRHRDRSHRHDGRHESSCRRSGS